MPGFPNLFCVYGPNTNLGGSSIIGMMEAQAGWIAQVARRIADTDRRTFEVRREVAERYDREMQARLGESVWAGCDNWYRDGGRITTNWPGLVGEYQRPAGAGGLGRPGRVPDRRPMSPGARGGSARA